MKREKGNPLETRAWSETETRDGESPTSVSWKKKNSFLPFWLFLQKAKRGKDDHLRRTKRRERLLSNL